MIGWRIVVAGIAAAVAWATSVPAAGAPPHETVTPQFAHALPNVPGKSLTAVVVDYPPGGKSSPHHHASSAFIFAYVLSGSIRSQVGDGPVKVYQAGESFFELPGQLHGVSENASDTEPAKLLAVFVAKTGDRLTKPEHH